MGRNLIGMYGSSNRKDFDWDGSCDHSDDGEDASTKKTVLTTCGDMHR
jgi:hypothetical protein